MKITVRHLGTEVVVAECEDPGWKTQSVSGLPTMLRYTDHSPYVLATLEMMAAQVIRIRKADRERIAAEPARI